jgi:hypothetical protein
MQRKSAASIPVSPPTVVTAAAYDPTKRDPQFAGADKSCLWELAVLAAHYHPSVRKFAEHIMMNPKGVLEYAGDPLLDFTVRDWGSDFALHHTRRIPGSSSFFAVPSPAVVLCSYAASYPHAVISQ